MKAKIRNLKSKIHLFRLKGLWLFWLLCNFCGICYASEITLSTKLNSSVLYSGAKQRAMIQISIKAPKETGEQKVNVNLAIVLDKSGSMAHSDKIEHAKTAAITALNKLGIQDVFSLIVYDDQVKTIVPAKLVDNKAAIEKQIKKIKAGGDTALFAGISIAASELRKNIGQNYVNRIILLSDGQANVGPNSVDTLANLGLALIKEKISISTIGVGRDYNEDLMIALSHKSDGNFYFVENSRELPKIFSKELESALNVAAKSIRIHIDLPKGIKAVGILGHDFKINDNSVDLYFNQVYGGFEKSFILEVEIPPNYARNQVDIATVKMSYVDALDAKTRYLNQSVAATFSKDKTKALQSTNNDVIEEVAIQENIVIMEQAVQQADQGNFSKAQKLLEKGAEKLKKTAKQTGNKKLNQEANINLMNAQNFNNENYKDNRKQMRSKNFQTRNNQTYQQEELQQPKSDTSNKKK